MIPREVTSVLGIAACEKLNLVKCVLEVQEDTTFMPPDDRLSYHGPNLNELLRKNLIAPEHKRQPCPYEKTCCIFYRVERRHQPQRSVDNKLVLCAEAPMPKVQVRWILA